MTNSNTKSTIIILLLFYYCRENLARSEYTISFTFRRKDNEKFNENSALARK